MNRPEGLGRVNAAIALTVGLAGAASPRTLLGLFGVDRREVTGAAAFGWRLFAARNLVIGFEAYRGNRTALDLFLPVQLLDQIVFAHALRAGAVPRSGAMMAMATSDVIIALDLLRRAAKAES
jgi:hypothetical protein